MVTLPRGFAGTSSAERAWLRRKAWRLRVRAHRTLVGLPTARRRATPDTIIIGAQRSGTTSLYRHLSAHPDVLWPVLVKSPHWFDINYDKDQRWYRSHFPLASQLTSSAGTRITGEASPYFLFHPAVPDRIAHHLPEVRLIAILRDPVTRAWSHYQHEVARGYEQLSFEAALDAEEGRIAPELRHLATPGYVGEHHRHHGYVARGLYAEQLTRYLDVIDRPRLLVLLTDELRSDPQSTHDRVCDFLAIDRRQLETAPRHHARDYDPLPDHLRARLGKRFDQPNRELATLLDQPLPWQST